MKQYIISERQLINYILDGISDSLTEARINPETESWYVFRLGTEDGINAYTITSSKYPDNVLGPIISAAKTRWKKEGNLPANPTPDAYFYQYLVDKIVNVVKENPGIAQDNSRAFSSAVRRFVPEIEQLNDQMLNKETAERMKREFYKEDKNSFKHKGAALIGKEMGNAGRPTIIQGKKKVTGLKDILLELFYYDEIQFYDDDIIAISEYAKDEMIRGGIPQSFADELNQIFNDPQNKIDPGTGVEFDYDLVNIPSQRIKNMLKHYKKIFDEEVFTDED